MRGSGTTYFEERNCSIPHFLVTGHTEDRFCDGSLRLCGVEQALHAHLRHAGFDAVVFFDSVNSLFCFDASSSRAMRGQQAQPAPAPRRRRGRGSISASGPLRGRLNQERQAAAPAPEPVGGVEEAVTAPYHLALRDAAAWDQVIGILRDRTRRVAVVLSNVSSLQPGFSQVALQYLQELGSDRNVRNNIVVYLFRGDNTLRNLAESSRIGTPAWQTFYNSNLLPLIISENPDENRVIVLGPPHREEVENLLNYLRTREERPVALRPEAVSGAAGPLAEMCAAQNRTLKYVMTVLERQTAEGPLDTIDVLALFRLQPERSFEEEAAELVGRDAAIDQLRRIPPAHVEAASHPDDRFAPPATGSATARQLGVRIVGGIGSGKHTMTGLYAHRLRELGYLPSGHVVRRRTADLMGNGPVAAVQNVRDAVQRALGGVLCVEDFDALTTAESWANWSRTQDELFVQFEAFGGQLALAYLGDREDMAHAVDVDARVLQYLPEELVLPDFNSAETAQIMRRQVSDTPGLSLSTELDALLDGFCDEWVGTTQPWQGTHEVERLVREMVSAHDLASPGESERVLGPSDVPESLRHHLEPRLESLSQAMERINEMVGLKAVKRFLRDRCLAAQWGTEDRTPGCYIFHGPPGTGKTVTARRMGDMLQQLGVLRRHDVVEIAAASLLRPNFSELLDRAVAQARGGVFFLDEAHQLAADQHYGPQVAQALVPIVENPDIRGDTCFILAGYTVEMNSFLALDPGLSRRFPVNHRVRFDDYDAHDLTLILKGLIDDEAGRGGVTYDWDEAVEDRSGIEGSQYLKRTEVAMRAFLLRKDPNFGNGGYMRDVYLSESKVALTSRLQDEHFPGSLIVNQGGLNATSAEERRTLTDRDLPPQHALDAGPLTIPVDELLAEGTTPLEDLVAKEDVLTYLAALDVTTTDDDASLLDDGRRSTLHLAISGPPGCGKHTVARAIAAEYHRLGLLDRADVTFVSEADLVAGYVGQTSERAGQVVAHALGGTLAVVSPSSMLARNATESTFGPQALAVVVGAMSSHVRDLAVILIDTQEGLDALYGAFASARSLLAHEFHLSDFSPAELREVFGRQCAERRLRLDEDAEEMMGDFFVNWVGDRGGLGEAAASWGNGLETERLVGELKLSWEASERKTAEADRRLWRAVSLDLFPSRVGRYLVRTSVVEGEALSRLESLTGLTSVKESIKDIERRIRRFPNNTPSPGYYAFLGNPGVGKTMVARLMGGMLKASKVLEQGHVVERTASMISTQSSFDQALKLARNGVLFIDEAHQLAQNPWGQEVIKRLVPACENPDVASTTCIILAGYPEPMRELLRSDPGLESRFGEDRSQLIFEDYTPEELLQIMDEMAAKASEIVQIGVPVPLEFTKGFRERSRVVFEAVVAKRDFGNGRFVRNYLHDAVSQLLRRLDDEGAGPEARTDLLTDQDVPRRYAHLLAGGVGSAAPPVGVPVQEAEDE